MLGGKTDRLCGAEAGRSRLHPQRGRQTIGDRRDRHIPVRCYLTTCMVLACSANPCQRPACLAHTPQRLCYSLVWFLLLVANSRKLTSPISCLVSHLGFRVLSTSTRCEYGHDIHVCFRRTACRPILSKLLSFSDADEDVVRDSFGEKETYTFRLW